MAGNALSGSTDVVASTSTLETTKPSTVEKLGVTVAFAAALFTGQDARAADIGNIKAAKIEACVSTTQDGLGKLKAMIEKKKGLGEVDKAAKLQTQYDETIAEAVKSCESRLAMSDTIAQDKTQIAQDKTQIAQDKTQIAQDKTQLDTLAEIRNTRLELANEIRARLDVVDNFNAGNISQTNSNIALIERANIYLAKARAVFTDQESIASLKQLESNIALLASRVNAGSGQKVATLNKM